MISGRGATAARCPDVQDHLDGGHVLRPGESCRARRAGSPENPQLDPNGHFIGRCEMIMGRLWQGQEETRARHPAPDRGETDSLAIRPDTNAGADRRGAGRVGVIRRMNEQVLVPANGPYHTNGRYTAGNRVSARPRRLSPRDARPPLPARDAAHNSTHLRWPRFFTNHII